MLRNSYDKPLGRQPEKVISSKWNKEKSKKGFCATKFVEFCNRTDLHGYKYIVMKDLNIFERIFWALAVAVSIVFAMNFVITAYKWYARNPIVTVIESTQGPIWDIPFPAVTICDLNAVSRKAARNFADNLTLPENITADEIYKTLRLVPLLHSTYSVEIEQKQELRKLQNVIELNHITIEHLFQQLSPAKSCNELVERCMWKNTVFRCDVIFQQIFTYFGLCCTFNYYAVEIPAKNKPSGEIFKQKNPRRVASCGYQTALSVLVNTNPEDYFSAAIASQGALVIIDNSYNIPNGDSPVRVVNPTTEVMIALSPERTYTTTGIKAFNPENRQCYFSDEVQVGSFQRYSFHNCMAFQRVNLIKKACECIPFYFPIKDYHRTCNFNDMDCLETVFVRKEVSDENFNNEQESVFRCLPECEHYDYPLEVALGKLARNVQLNGLPFFNNINLENRSLVNVFFNDLVSTRYRRDVYLNWQNLLASFGGLLSLMLGFTLIAGFDLIIFFTFGIAASLTSRNTEEKKSTAVFRSNKIYVQEIHKKYDLIEKALKNKMLTEKDIGKWQTDMRYGNNRF